MRNFRTIWESLGFRDNPYSAEPLEPTEEDFGLFVGREAESRLFATTISNKAGCISVVEGDVGVGKTSFVNAMEYAAYQRKVDFIPRVLPSFRKIQFFDGITVNEFLLSVLSNGIFSLIQLFGAERVTSEAFFREMYTWLNQLIYTSKGIQAGITVLGTGGSFGRTTGESPVSTTQVPTMALIVKLEEFVERVRDRFELDGCMIPVNNMDIVDEDRLISFLNQIRDGILDRNYIWWVLIGSKGSFSLFERKARRISEKITGTGVALNPLSSDELLEAVRVRMQALRMRADVQAPIPEEVIRLLYEVSKGEIRFIFKRATDLIIEVKSLYPSAVSISLEQALGTLRGLAEKRIAALYLTRAEEKILSRMAEVGEFRPKEYALFGLKSAQALNKYLSKFVEEELLSRTKEGGASVYRTRGDVNFLFPAPYKPEIQRKSL